MPLKLNKISDDVIKENIPRNRERVKKFQTADPSSKMRSDAVRYATRYADAAEDLALGLYQQQGDPQEIRHYLAIAAKELLHVLSLQGENASLVPIDFEAALALAVCFCDKSVYDPASTVPVTRFFSNPESLSFFAVLVQYLDVLRKFLSTNTLAQEAWQRALAECSKSNAGKYDAVVTKSKLNALKAVATGDPALLNENIAILIEDHENEAKRGENQNSRRGFICMPALMFARLGADRKLPVTVQSPYLPLYLLS